MFTAGVYQEWINGEDGNPIYWPIDNYFYTGERTTYFLGHEIHKQHHTLTQILMGLLSCCFELQAIEEAKPSDEMLDIPGIWKYVLGIIPLVLSVVMVKVCIERIKEIKEGEEDDLSQY